MTAKSQKTMFLWAQNYVPLGAKLCSFGRKAKKFPCYDGKNYAIFFFKIFKDLLRERADFLDPPSLKKERKITAPLWARKKTEYALTLQRRLL